MGVKNSLIVFILLSSFAPKIDAQIMLGVGGAYGDDIKQYAANLRVYYFPNHKICMGPEYARFPKIEEGHQQKELTEYGISAHYIFLLSEKVGFYPLIGFNYGIETEEEFGLSEETRSFGANLGGGFHLEYGKFFPFAEYKYVASGLPQNVISVGLLINMQKRNKEKHRRIDYSRDELKINKHE